MADGQLGASGMGSDLTTKHGKYYLMDDDPRLPKMPAKPTLLDYFECRAKGINHMLQSATHAPDSAGRATLKYGNGFPLEERSLRKSDAAYEKTGQ